MKDVVSFIPRARDQVQVTDRVTEVLNVGPRSAEIIQLRERSRMSAIGWRFFQDSAHTNEKPLVVPANVRTQLPVDGAGMISTAYGVKSSGWLHPQNARFFPDKVGDLFFYRLNLSVSPSVNNRSVFLDFDIGTANHVWNKRWEINSGAGKAVAESFECEHGFSPRATQNGGAFYITPEVDVEVTGLSVLAFKAFTVIE